MINLNLALRPFDWYQVKNSPKKFEIFPRNNEWNYAILASFLNELIGSFKTRKSTSNYIIFRRNVIINDEIMKWKVYANITDPIQVKVSRDYLACNWLFTGDSFFLSNYAIWKTLNDGKRISLDEMERQQRYYETTKETCNCSENKLCSI